MLQDARFHESVAPCVMLILTLSVEPLKYQPSRACIHGCSAYRWREETWFPTMPTAQSQKCDLPPGEPLRYLVMNPFRDHPTPSRGRDTSILLSKQTTWMKWSPIVPQIRSIKLPGDGLAEETLIPRSPYFAQGRHGQAVLVFPPTESCALLDPSATAARARAKDASRAL